MSVFPIKRSPRTNLSHDLFTTSLELTHTARPKATEERGSWLMHHSFFKAANVETLLDKHQNKKYIEGAKQK